MVTRPISVFSDSRGFVATISRNATSTTLTNNNQSPIRGVFLCPALAREHIA